SLPTIALPPLPMPAKAVLADPPWPFGDKLPGNGRGAEKHYNTMTLDQIKSFPIPPLAPDAVLFLWRVAAMGEEAYQVMRAWGFTPKSEIVWRKAKQCKACTGKGVSVHLNGQRICADCDGSGFKLQMGMGRYVRLAHEVCLIGARGSCFPEAHDVLSV